MKKFIHYCLILVLFLILGCKQTNSSPKVPKVVQGILDLQSWDFSKDGPVNLDGEWEFYWKEFCGDHLKFSGDKFSGDKFSGDKFSGDKFSGDKFSGDARPCVPTGEKGKNYITVPGNWNNYIHNGKPVGGQGFATYQLKVILPNTLELLAIKILDQGTNYRMYVNGQLLTEVGKIGKTKDETISKTFPQLVLLPNARELEIVFHVSNFDKAKGGLWNPVILGNLGVLQKQREQNIALDLLVFGALSIMSFYHLGLFALRRKDRSPLYFGMFCFLVSLRPILTGENFIETHFLDFPWSLARKMEYLTIYLGAPLFLLYVNSLFPQEISGRIKNLLIFFSTTFSSIVFFFPPIIFTYTLQTMQAIIFMVIIISVYAMTLGMFRKKEGAKTFFIGFILFSLFMINDILYANEIIYTGYYGPFGLLIFIFSQSFFLSRRFSRAFSQAEKFSEELKTKSDRLEETSIELENLNNGLEAKIEERTKDLQESKQEIEDLNHFTSLVNSLSDLDKIFTEISKHIYHKYGIKGLWLFLPNKNKKYLYAYKVYSYDRLPEDKYNYMKNLKAHLNDQGGMLYKVYQRQKPFYLSKIPKFEFEIDREIVETLSVKSSLYVPLVTKKECIGVFGFSNLSSEMKLSKKEIRSITNLCYQVAGLIETVHLLEEVNDAKKETELLNEISKIANSSFDIKKNLEKIIQRVGSEFNVNICNLMTVDKTSKTIQPLYLPFLDGVSTSEMYSYLNKNPLNLNEMNHVHGFVYHFKRTIYTQNLLEPEHPTEKEIIVTFKMKSYLCIPLLIHQEVIGFVGFSKFDEIMILSEEEIKMLEKVADVLSGAVHNFNLYQITEKQKQIAQSLNILLKQLNETNNIHEINKKVNCFIRDNYRFPYSVLTKFDKKENGLFVLTGVFPSNITEIERKIILNSKMQVDLANDNSIHKRLFLSKEPEFILDVTKDVSTEQGKQLQQILRHKSWLCLPIFYQNEILGTLEIFDSQLNYISKEDIEKLKPLAEHLAGIINNAVLYKQIEEEKEKALTAQDEVEKLNEFTKLINSTSDLSLIFKEVYSYLNQTFGFDILWTLLINPETKEFYSDKNMTFSKSEKDIDIEFYRNFKMKLEPSLGTLYQTYIANVPLYIPNFMNTVSGVKNRVINQYNGEVYQGSKIDLKITIKAKLISIIQIPLFLQNDVIGILCVSTYNQKVELNKENMEKLVRFGNQIAGVIYNAELLKQTEDARGEIVLAHRETQKQKEEIEALNSFIKNINSLSSLDLILDEIFKFIVRNFSIDFGFIQLIEGETMVTKKIGNYSNILNEEQIKFIQNLKIPLNESGGIPYKTYKRKKRLFIPVSYYDKLFTKGNYSA